MVQWPLMKETITLIDKIKMVKFILSTKKFTNGAKVKEFENNWNNWLGSKYSLFVSSGSTANLLLLSAIKELYKLNDGDKVLVPACTWVTNVSPVFQVGLQPIFADINLKNFSFDLEEC
jgi:CDP-6-deoxy-D-xylo-4-hexulose-3-dehydrase